MKRKKYLKRIGACLLAASILMTEMVPAHAAIDTTISGGDAGYEEPGVEIPKDVPGDEEPGEETPKDEPGVEVPVDIPAEEEPVLEFPTEEEVSKMFPGLESADGFTAEELEAKEELLDHASEWSMAESGEQYAKDELVFLADTKEEAEEYAKAFNGTLTSFSYGVGVITLNADPAYEMATVEDALTAAADPTSALPAVWPNYYVHLEDVEGDDGYLECGEEATGIMSQAYTDPYLNPKLSAYGWYNEAVNANVAYDNLYRGKGVTVAVIDSGVRLTHEDLSGTVAYTVDAGFGDTPYGNHGTHVAGIIGARSNDVGGRGIAPECNIISLKVLGESGGKDSDVMAAINLAKTKKANIINISLGGANYNGLFNTTVTQAYNAGILIVCGAGNDRSETTVYPAGYDHALNVAALNKSMQRADFSNWGKTVDFCAPGVDIWSTVNETDIFNGIKNGEDACYEKMQGTSMACPIITGSAAVLWSHAGGIGSKKVDNVVALLKKGSVKVPGNGNGYGYVDLAKALGIGGNGATPAAPSTFLPAPGTYTQEKVPVRINYPEKDAKLYYSLDGKAVTYKNGKLSDNAIPYDGTPVNVTGKGTVTINVIAIRESSKTASPCTTAKYILKPYVGSVKIESKTGVNILVPGKTLALKAYTLPDYAPNKKVTWSISPAGYGVTVNASGVVNASATATARTYTVKAKSEDGPYAEFSVQVKTNTNPVESVTTSSKAVTLPIGKYHGLGGLKIVKADGSLGNMNDLAWVSDKPDVLTVATESGYTYPVLTAKKVGRAKLTGTAKDGYGKTVSITVTVTQPVTDLKIVGSNKLSRGKSQTLTVTMGAKATNEKLSWSISPEGCGVSVAGGKVTATKDAVLRDYTITAKALDGSGQSDKIAITVVSTMSTKLTVGDNKKTLNDTLFRVTNSDGAVTSATYTVNCDTANWDVANSAPGLVTVSKLNSSSFKVTTTGSGTGDATITVMTNDGTNIKATVKIKVANPATRFYIAPKDGRSNYLAKGCSLKLVPYFESRSGKVETTAKQIAWTSADPSVVKVDANGNVTCLNTTKTNVMITASTTDGSRLTSTFNIHTCDKTKSIAVYRELSTGNKYYTSFSTKEGTYWDFLIENTTVSGGKGSLEYSAKSSGTGVQAMIQPYGSLKKLRILADKKGTYTVTISCKDGSTAKKTIKVVVK